jgi:hypothetical protein
MAETILVMPDLTPGMVEAGRALVAGLDAHGLSFEAAFWSMDDENGRWNLILSSRAVKFDGTRALYTEVDKVISELRLQKHIWIGIVSIIGHRTPLMKSLQDTLGTAASVDGVRLDGAFLGGVFLPGCLLYRLSRRQRLSAIPVEARNPVKSAHATAGRIGL